MTLEKFDISITNASKGMALMLILWHHLFYEKPEMGWVVFQTALLAKVCVGIYVLLSGYGLAESSKKKKLEILSFYKKRVIKLYMNYWLIALIFIPIGTLFMGRSLESVFGKDAYFDLFIQMIGIHMFTDVGYGYNATWWFMSLIIVLYAIFPFAFSLTKKFKLWFLAFCAVLLFVPIPLVNDWIFPFAVGIYLSQIDGFVRLFGWLQKQGNLRILILLSLTIFAAWYRQNGYLFDSVRADTFFGILLILWTTELVLVSSSAKKALEFIGIHSFNIFLFHTFIYYYYFPDFIYSFKNPLLIFTVLLGICLIISMGIEAFKKRVEKLGILA
jgi:membrane-bound acyltransferase YfiQ involved in biofilm formation